MKWEDTVKIHFFLHGRNILFQIRCIFNCLKAFAFHSRRLQAQCLCWFLPWFLAKMKDPFNIPGISSPWLCVFCAMLVSVGPTYGQGWKKNIFFLLTIKSFSCGPLRDLGSVTLGYIVAFRRISHWLTKNCRPPWITTPVTSMPEFCSKAVLSAQS